MSAYYANKLSLRLTQVRKEGVLDYLCPDGKTQVTVEYDDEGKPIHLDAVVLSTQHDENVTIEQLRKDSRPDAEKSVKTRLVIEKIIEIEDLQIKVEEFEAKIEELAKAQDKTVEEYKKSADRNELTRVMNRMLSEKFFAYLKENNKIINKE